ncbi:MAG: hypothetical protein ACRDPY_11955 [Streptosporangiaceae bacterium]
MARIVRMPPKSELPGGPHREFVEELRRYYRAAGRPPLRQVSRALEGRSELKEVTASQETVRRMLRGMVLPTDWDRVYAVFFVLCEMGNIDPEADRWEDAGGYGESSESNSQALKRLWDTALEAEPDSPPIPRSASPQQAPQGFGRDDPWAADTSGFGPATSAEPPF